MTIRLLGIPEVARSGQRLIDSLIGTAFDTLALPGSWRRNTTLRGVMDELLARPATWAYRGMEERFLIQRNEISVQGNPESVCAILDPYNAARSRNPIKAIPAHSLPLPGLNVMLTVPSAYFDGEAGTVLVRFRLGKALDRGGKLYRDVRSGYVNAAYVTLPKNAAVPVQVIPPSALPALRELITIENGLFATRHLLSEISRGNSSITPHSPRYQEAIAQSHRLESAARPLRLAIDALAKTETQKRVAAHEK